MPSPVSLPRRVVQSLPVVVSLGLGVAVFALAVGASVRARTGSLAFEKSKELRLLIASYPERSIGFAAFSYLDVRDLAAGALAPFAAFSPVRSLPGRFGEVPLELAAEFQTSDLRQVLGFEAAAGRLLQPSDEVPSGPLHVLATDRLWRRLGSPSEFVGTTLSVKGHPATIVGRLERDFAGSFGDPIDLVLPLEAIDRLERSTHLTDRSTAWLVGVARSPLSTSALQAQLEPLASRLREADPQVHEGLEFRVFDLESFLLGEDVPRALRLLSGAAWLVLGLCLANAALLLIGTVLARRAEIAVRRALGSDGTDLLRWASARMSWQVVSGWVLGVLALLTFGPFLLERSAIAPSSSTLEQVGSFEIGLSLGAGLVAAVTLTLIAWRTASAVSPHETIRPQHGESRGSALLRSTLNLVQIALCLVIVAGTLSAADALRELTSIDYGLELDTRVTQVGLTADQDPSAAAQSLLVPSGAGEPSAGRPRALAGPRLAPRATMSVVARRPGDADEQAVQLFRSSVTDAYLEVLDIPLLAGRFFDQRDLPDSAPVAVLSRSAAANLFGDSSPLGRDIVVEPELQGVDRFTVIGVVEDVAGRGTGQTGLRDDEVYLPFRQQPQTSFFVLEPADASARAEAGRQIQAALPDAFVYPTTTLEERYAELTKSERFTVLLTATFTVVALLIAAFGLFSSLRLHLVQEERSVAIHRALGAAGTRVARLMARRQLFLLGGGLTLGILLAVSGARLVRGQFDGLLSVQLGVLALATVIVGACGLAALGWPLIRALRVDPAGVLRRS